MSIFEAIILGLVQGLTEFLPVSSSGHLTVLQTVFGIQEPTMAFDVLLHIATLIPVVFIFWKDIWGLIRNPFQKTVGLLLVGTIPAVLAALLFNSYIDQIFAGTKFLAFGFFITGILLLVADSVKDGHKKMKDVSYADAALIGCMQAVAIIPAISRSGSTISVSLARRLDRKTAAKFSFLLSIPAILGAAALELIKILQGKDTTGTIGILPMLFGFIAAMLTGYLAVSFMMRLIREKKLRMFSFYVFGLGALILFDQLVTHVFF